MGGIGLLWTICLTFLPLNTRGAPNNRGTEFVVAFMENYQTSTNVELLVTTFCTTSVSVTVSGPRWTNPSLNSAFTVTNGQVQTVSISNNYRMSGASLSYKGILISATDEIVVYGVNKESYSTDGFLALPTDVLGTEYYITTYNPASYCQLLVAARLDNTAVAIRFGPNNGLNVTYSGSNYYKNDWLNLTIQAYDTLQVQTSSDLTGTYIVSNKAIVVYSGNKYTDIGSGSTSDHVVDQHYSVDKWGKSFVIAPIPTKTTGDYFRFIASEFDTTVTVSGNIGNSAYSDSFTISVGGHWVEKHYSSSLYAAVTASKPIYIVQYVLSQVSISSDPAMMVLTPTEQYSSDYTFSTPSCSMGSCNHYLMFIADNPSSLVLNGQTFSATVSTAITGTSYYGGYKTISSGTYTLRHSSPTTVFGAYLVGLRTQESYAFAVGRRLAPVNTACAITNTVTGDGIDNDCDGKIDEELCTTANNYADDDGDTLTEEDCATPYPIDGVYIQWEQWGPCVCNGNTPSSGGTRKRVRSCSNPEPQYDGAQCAGVSEETDTTCTPNSGCAVDGNWAQWGSWSSCSVTCGGSTFSRTRTCTDPVPYNGASCAGNSTDTATCNTNNCPIDGAWTQWSAFSSCAYICGTGLSNRTRTCANPAPQYGGAACTGDSFESSACTGTCAVDGGWSSWTSWGACTKTCGTGIKARSRNCDNPVASNGGLDCSGDSSEFDVCNTAACPTVASGSYQQICPSGWFTCQSGAMTCIEDTFKCDCANDCDDGSDETTTYASCASNTTCSNTAIGIGSNSLTTMLILGVLSIMIFCVF